MMTDLVLAIAHHLLMFSLLAVLVMELMLIRPEMTSAHVTRVGRLDIAYGAIAGAILIVGFARVFYGLKGPNYYLTNLFFWAKMAAFLAAGGLSLPPTIRIIAWRAGLRADAGFRPQGSEIRSVRGYMHWEAVVFALIPVFAALMARGYGAR
jgi:putative membrane protein